MTHCIRRIGTHAFTVLWVGAIIHTSAVDAASFDCTKSVPYFEKAICDDEELSKLDDDLSEIYNAAYADSAASDQKQLRIEQLRWLRKRNACLSRACIQDAYETRLSELGTGSQCPMTRCTKFADSGANKALWESTERGDVDGAKAALSRGADTNVCGPSYERPLHVAVNRRDLSVVRELLGAKANPNVKNCPGNTPLVLAAHGNDANIALSLLSAGADKELGGGSSPLQMAAFHGHVDMLRTLLSHRADPNAVHGDTAALLLAARNWHVDAVTILLEAGANPNFQTSYGGTALFDAVGAFRIAPLKPEEEERALKVVKLLVRYGADVNAKTAGQSSLQRARAIKESTIVDFLTSVGARP